MSVLHGTIRPMKPVSLSGRQLADLVRFVEDQHQLGDTVMDSLQLGAVRAVVTAGLHYGSKVDGEFGCCHGAANVRAGLQGLDEPDPGPLPDDCLAVECAAEVIRPLAVLFRWNPGFRQEWTA